MLDIEVQPRKDVYDQEIEELKHGLVKVRNGQVDRMSIPNEYRFGVPRLTIGSMESHQPKVSEYFKEGRLDS